MGKVVVSISMSLDGFIAGPGDRPGRGLGEGGDVLHAWLAEVTPEELFATSGSMVVGRRMFDVSGAWGGNPPGGLPCFVLTHHAPPEWSGPDSKFTFVADGIRSAVDQARAAAGGKDVGIGGGGDIIRQALEAGLVDELRVQLIPVMLGAGVRLFDTLKNAPIRLGGPEVVESAHATHLRYMVLDHS